jgi:SAM-dependent methyltransferase
MNKKILDPACGSRMFWFDRNNPDVVFGDIRKEKHILCDGRVLEVCPDILMDFKRMPFKDGQFKLVVFDPPHLKASKNGWQVKKYGSLGLDWRNDLKFGFEECYRVLEKFGILIFKWNEYAFPVSEIIKIVGQQPLFGHRRVSKDKTIWLTFMKKGKYKIR